MKNTILLEMSDTEPKQFRITVVEDTTQALMNYHMRDESKGFAAIGYYDSVEEAMAILEPYLSMENSR